MAERLGSLPQAQKVSGSNLILRKEIITNTLVCGSDLRLRMYLQEPLVTGSNLIQSSNDQWL